jgi:glycosyltransferase involved in cell wall biosynthesis
VGDAFLWLAVGRLEPPKDYANLLDAAAHLQTTAKDNWVICVAGQGPLLAELRSRADSLGIADRVRFLGVRKDIPDLMNAADGYVMSSAWEGMPMVLLEAAATGLPIVATDVGGNREVVLDGNTGFLVPPKDPEALAETMLHVMALSRDERGRLGEAGRTHVESNYSLDQIVERWEALYHELLARSGGRPRRVGAKGR